MLRLKSFGSTVASRTKQSISGVWYVLRRPTWAVAAIVLAFIVSTVIYLSINFGFYGSLLGSHLPLVDKFQTIIVLIQNMGRSYFEDANGVLLLVVSLLQGIAISVFIFTAKRNRKMDAMVAGRSGFALVLATLGLGCVPCGTSLLIPVMTLVFSSSAPALLGAANAIILVAALGLTLFSLYKIGHVAYKYHSAEV